MPISQEVGDRFGVATTLSNIGGVYYDINKPQKALEYYEKALPILEEVGDRFGVANTLNNLGLVYQDTNEPEKAIDHWEKSVKIILEMHGGLKKETGLTSRYYL